jgi:hypothetical protein
MDANRERLRNRRPDQARTTRQERLDASPTRIETNERTETMNPEPIGVDSIACAGTRLLDRIERATRQTRRRFGIFDMTGEEDRMTDSADPIDLREPIKAICKRLGIDYTNCAEIHLTPAEAITTTYDVDENGKKYLANDNAPATTTMNFRIRS